jgi:hypothetical protein
VKGRTSALNTIIQRCREPQPSQRFASAADLLRALEGVTGRGTSPSSSRWWWEFHEGAAAVTYWLMLIPLWQARGAIGGTAGRAVFVAGLASVIVAANLRLHLLFTSRFYSAELKWLRPRVRRWILSADILFAVALVVAALLLDDERSPLAVLLFAFGLGAAVAFLVIEPATARAAFRSSSR